MAINLKTFLSARGPNPAARPDTAQTLVIALPHASDRVPDWVSTPDPAVGRERHEVLDIGSAALGDALARRLGAEIVAADCSRLVVDMNRDISDPSAIVPGPDGLLPGDLLARFQCHRRYHRALAQAVQPPAPGLPAPVLVDLHSFTRMWDGARRRVDIGVLAARPDDQLALRVLANLQKHCIRAWPGARRLVAAMNEPYDGSHPGIYTARHYGGQGIPVLTFEVCNDLLGSAHSVRRTARLLACALRASLSAEAAQKDVSKPEEWRPINARTI